MRSNSWVLCKRSPGSTHTQWHCPACGDKWSAGSGLDVRLLVVYGEDEQSNVCFRWGKHEDSIYHWAEAVLDYLRQCELVTFLNNKRINWVSILKALNKMDGRNFARLQEVMQPSWERAVRPGAQWCEAELHCSDAQLSVNNWAVQVPIGRLKNDPPPMTSDELRSLMNTCLALIEPDSYIKKPKPGQKKVQFQAETQRSKLMPQLEEALSKLALQRQGAE
eukprot:6019516-Amphidinium_carterae.1